MARRAVRFLGAAVLAVAIYTVVSILIQSPRVLSATEPFILYPQSQGADAGAPSGRARPDDTTPLPRVHARPEADGTSTAAGGRTRPDGASLRQAQEHGRVVLPLRLHEHLGGSSTAGARRRQGDASTAPGGRTRPEGASLRQAQEHGRVVLPLRSHEQPGGASTAGAQARSDGASTAGAHARSDGGSPPPPYPSASNGTTPQPRGKAKGAECHDHLDCHCHCHNHAAAAPPPPRTAPPPTLSTANKTNERSTVNRSMLVIGCLYSLLSFCNPIIIFWSTGRSVEATDAFHGWLDLIASALSCLAWLLFALSQLHGKDGKVIGTTGVVVNAIGFALYAAYLVAKLAVGEYMGIRDCIWVLLSFFGSYVVIVLVTVYGPMQRESKTALVISILAFILQILSQLIPLVTVLPLLWSMVYPPQIAQRPEHINSRKLTVFSRVGSFGLSLFWVSYCSMTYEHDYFQLSNDVGAAMSFLSMILYLVYTLRPHDVDYPPAP